MTLIIETVNPDFKKIFKSWLNSKRESEIDVRNTVSDIIKDVRTRGDDALFDLTLRFDRFKLSAANLRIRETEINEAFNLCETSTIKALELAAARIDSYHLRQIPKDEEYTDSCGVFLGHKFGPVESAGLYVPGGTAAYPSSVLMNAVPAKTAGVKRIVMAVPTPDNKINPLVLAAAKVAGVDEIYRIGGAQAIAALSFGTQSIEPVVMIAGPGNAYVAEAKRQVFGFTGIDMIAGPSEILVIADSDNNPSWLAADLLSQAEHDTAARSVFITDNKDFANLVISELEKQLKILPRKEIAEKSWNNNGAVILVKDFAEAATISNRIAPEHLELAVADPLLLSKKIKNAGAIFLGRYTPEALGDYVGGTNHVLPTDGSAKFSSGLGVMSFMKRTSLLGCNKSSIKTIGSQAVTIAEAEGLHAHALSVKVRLDD